MYGVHCITMSMTNITTTFLASRRKHTDTSFSSNVSLLPVVVVLAICEDYHDPPPLPQAPIQIISHM